MGYGVDTMPFSLWVRREEGIQTGTQDYAQCFGMSHWVEDVPFTEKEQMSRSRLGSDSRKSRIPLVCLLITGDSCQMSGRAGGRQVAAT